MSEDRGGTQAHRIAHLSRRRHPASAAKVLTTGLATSGFLGTVGLLAAHGQAPSTAAPTPAAQSATDPTPIVVTDTVHRTVFVDEFGNPVTPPAAPAALTATPPPSSDVAASGPSGGVRRSVQESAAPSVAGPTSPMVLDPTVPAAPVDAAAGSIVPSTTGVATRTTHPASNTVATNPAAPAPVEVPNPAPTTGTSAVDPATTAAPAATAPPATTAPAPVVTEAPTTAPPVTAPPETSPPPPPPTTAAPPPPTTAPAPPSCQGTQCP